MTQRPVPSCPTGQPSSSATARARRQGGGAALISAALLAWVSGAATAANLGGSFPNYPISEEQRSTARQVASAGVPLSELAPNAPERYTVKRGDTLWDISSLFLRSPWRWPELWGMNLDQVANPHLIYPGQLLVLVKSNGYARLQFGESLSPNGTVKLSPQARSSGLDGGPISGIPLHLIQPFLNEAVVLDQDTLDAAPRIVAGQDDRVVLGRGDTIYVRGKLAEQRDWRVFRQPKPLRDPETGELLGYEAAFVGNAQYLRRGAERIDAEGNRRLVPATFVLGQVRQEANMGDRLMPAAPAEELSYAPHAPTRPVQGRLVSIYGDGVNAGQHQIVALNRGRKDGMQAGHVLALLRAGSKGRDGTSEDRAALQMPDERNGNLFVFRVFERVSYALILDSQGAVRAGDRFINP